MSAFDVIFFSLFAFILGFAIRDSIQVNRDLKEIKRETDEAYERVTDKIKSHTVEIVVEYRGIDHRESEGEFWKGFCQTCRGFHGQGKCPGKWSVL